MNRKQLAVAILLGALIIPLLTQSAEAQLRDNHYRVGIADVLEITIIPEGEPAAKIQRLVNVRPDGYISLEYVGEIYAAEKTFPQLMDEIKKKLSQYFTTVDVTVNLSTIRAKKFFVMGEVTRPGVYPLDGEKTVLDAVALAGSYTALASLNSVMLVRSENGRPRVYRVRLKDVIKKGRFAYNRTLKDGDVIYVPKTGWAKLGGFFYKIIYPFRDLLGVAVSISAAYIIFDRTAR